LVFYNANESHCSEFACCDLLSEAQRSTNTAKFNHSMSKFFDIFGLLQPEKNRDYARIGCDLLSEA
jgi:hypothetical protein